MTEQESSNNNLTRRTPMNKSYDTTVAETRFTGLFIHSEILHFKKISYFEKVLLGWIDSYYNEGKGGCFASNEHLSDLMDNCRPNRIAKSISKLRKLGLIVDVSFNGRIRVIRSTIGQTIEKIRKQNERQSFPRGKQQDSRTGKASDPSPYYTIGKYEKEETSPSASSLFSFFCEKKLERNPDMKIPSNKAWNSIHFEKLLKIDGKKFDDVKRIMGLCLAKGYWRIVSSPEKFRNIYDELVEDINNKSSGGSGDTESNREIAEKQAKEFNSGIGNPRGSKITCLNKYVEIGNGVHQPTCINYYENGFKDQLESAMRKWG